MAKKNVKKFAFAIAACIGVLAIVMFALPMIQYRVDVTIFGQSGYNKVNISGFNLLAGAENLKGVTYNTVTDKTTEYAFDTNIKASFGPIISLILSVVGIVAVVLSNFVAKKYKNIVKFVACGAFVVAGVLAIALAKASFVSANEIGESAAEYYSTAIGAWLVCILDVGAGVCSLAA